MYFICIESIQVSQYLIVFFDDVCAFNLTNLQKKIGCG